MEEHVARIRETSISEIARCFDPVIAPQLEVSRMLAFSELLL